MKVLNWRGMHGYGDFIPPFQFAYNESVRIDEDIHVIFHFVETRRKYKPQDANTYEDLIRYVVENIDKKDVTREVTWEARYTVPYEMIPEPMHSNSCDAMYGIHNFRPIKKELLWTGEEETQIAVVSTRKHAEKFRNIKYRDQPVGIKAWKDGWPDHWDEFIHRFERLGFKVKEVHYETPIDEAVDIIRKSCVTYSYHAGAAWLARFLCSPLIISSTNPLQSQNIFEWCVHYDYNRFDEVHFNIYDDIETSLEKRDKFLFNAELYKHAVAGTHVYQNLVHQYSMRSWPYHSHAQKKTWDPYIKEHEKDIQKVLEKIK